MTSDSEDIRFSGDYPSWVPDGTYEARCKDYSDPRPYRGTQKVFLTFELLNEPWAGTELRMFLNVPFSGITPGSRYFKYWTAANKDRMPSRNAKMSPHMFKDKKYRVTTKTVIPKRGSEEMPFDYHYSKVDHIELLNLPDTKDDGEAYQS